MPGPVPKRSEQRRRANKSEIPTDTAPSGFNPDFVGNPLIEWPEPNADWHEIARDWYLSLQESGQVIYYQQSDVAQARLLAESMHRLLSAPKFNGQLLASILSGASSLGAAEGDRRRVRMELARATNGLSDEEKLAQDTFEGIAAQFGVK